MFQSIYIENDLLSHPKVKEITERYNKIPHIPIERYGEVFNRKAQNFRLQKKAPSLILARKHQNYVLETPPGYGIGGTRNFYFSHMLNCIFDCRYCFLQGMYQSAHYVIFVNFEDFKNEIIRKIEQAPHESCYFFSGYDCDSLALENITHFIEGFLPLFQKHLSAFMEIRTKSTNINFLLKQKPVPNVIVAFTLTPHEIASALEHKTPSLEKRLEALQKLQNNGWQIGIRFDPLIYCDDFETIYDKFFKLVFSKLDPKKIHSVSLGAFRLPKPVFKNIIRLYPDEKLFAHSLDEKNQTISYKKELEQKLIGFCRDKVLQNIPEEIFFPCEVSCQKN